MLKIKVAIRAIGAELQAFWLYLDGKKRAISIVLANGINVAEYIGTEWQIKSATYFHIIHLVAYLAGMLGLLGIAAAAERNKKTTEAA